MTPTLREFGNFVAGANYVLRPGGYAVVRNRAGEIAIIAAPSGYVLPGGGPKDNETFEETAIRETHEECGLTSN